MRIGIFGTWGMNVPGVAFGGFETAYSELASRLAGRGHEVLFYCRRERYPPPARLPGFRGVRLKYVPTVDTKNLSGITATWAALFDALRTEHLDVFLFANVGMGFHCLAAKMLGRRVVLNVDGLDWERGKWGRAARTYYRSAAHAAVLACDRLITDSRVMQDYYRRRFSRESTFIAYGAPIVESTDPTCLTRFGVAPRDYFLIVSRFVPENNVDLMIRAFKQAKVAKKLLVVGGANHPTEHERRLRSLRGDRVLFPGYVRDRAVLNELLCNCFAYLHGHSVGGTNPALLDALGAGCCVLALDTPFNAEVLAGHGLLFPPTSGSLSVTVSDLAAHPAKAERYRQMGRRRARNAYDWEHIVSAYEQLLAKVAD